MVFVKKLNGEMQEYDEFKLRRSLVRAGADSVVIKKIVSEVDKILYEGIETKKIFRFAFKAFKKYHPYVASRYDLKNSILRLGREGFAFEKFISKILEKQGYTVKLNQIIQGKFISHEIDVSAVKGKERLMVECKHHIRPWLGTNIQTALYVYARYIDVEKSFTAPLLVTNTKFSRQVIAYAKGVNLKLMGWKYPTGNSLESCIEKYKLYPITMLSNINERDVLGFLKNEILLLDDLCSMDADKISKMLKIPKSKATIILTSSRILCKRR